MSSRTVATGAHTLVVLDGAGWHQTGGCLRVPGNLTLLHLPPCCSELNFIELASAKLKHLLRSVEVSIMGRLRTVLG